MQSPQKNTWLQNVFQASINDPKYFGHILIVPLSYCKESPCGIEEKWEQGREKLDSNSGLCKSKQHL